jgi:hypothetical protein
MMQLGEAAAAPTALEDLGPLVLGAGADGAVKEHDLHTRTAELLDQEHLVGIAPGQAIGGRDVEAVDHAGGHGIAQPLQGRAGQASAALALYEEDVLGLEPRAEPRRVCRRLQLERMEP